ncbi:hypothetical protein T11_17283 [Trichinella zimbabwensis]|uniref:Uncharacterized protein n=1 Tax=Trichinella zimbabwensis TaxID=268475 RepID=A0A0V1GVB3_9BILA|nr:hypothetical protein T11_17283 [Trichinella zimbabwensis]
MGGAGTSARWPQSRRQQHQQQQQQQQKLYPVFGCSLTSLVRSSCHGHRAGQGETRQDKTRQGRRRYDRSVLSRPTVAFGSNFPLQSTPDCCNYNCRTTTATLLVICYRPPHLDNNLFIGLVGLVCYAVLCGDRWAPAGRPAGHVTSLTVSLGNELQLAPTPPSRCTFPFSLYTGDVFLVHFPSFALVLVSKRKKEKNPPPPPPPLPFCHHCPTTVNAHDDS